MKIKEIINDFLFPKKINNALINESNRIEWVRNTLKKIPEGYRLLDAGAGEQQYKKYCSHLNYVSQDFGEYKPQEVDKGLQMKQWDYGRLDIISDIISIPEKDASFDAIMCTEVFEHISNPIAAVEEFSRLLKKGGYLLLTAPFCSLTHFAPYHFYTGFNKYFYQEILPKNNFEIIEISHNGNYFEFIAQELRRTPHMVKKYTNQKMSFSSYFQLSSLVKQLNKISKVDQGSSELLSFGLHIFAQKKS